jgi:hypothetical protein
MRNARRRTLLTRKDGKTRTTLRYGTFESEEGEMGLKNSRLAGSNRE